MKQSTKSATSIGDAGSESPDDDARPDGNASECRRRRVSDRRAKRGSGRSGATPIRPVTSRASGVRAAPLTSGASGDARAASRRKWPTPRAKRGTPSRACSSASHSTFSVAMSTPAGHSVLQALQATQVPSTSRRSAAPRSAALTAPLSSACSALARALVVRASSRPTIAGGHIVPVSFLQRPAPKHFSIARSKPLSAAYESRGRHGSRAW